MRILGYPARPNAENQAPAGEQVKCGELPGVAHAIASRNARRAFARGAIERSRGHYLAGEVAPSGVIGLLDR